MTTPSDKSPADSNAATSTIHHASPPLGVVAIIFALLFNVGLYFVVSLKADQPHFPGPWESADAIVTYFQAHSWEVTMCAFFQFGAAIALGEFAVSAVSRLRFFWVNATGVYIGLFGGLMAALNMAASACVLWTMAYPGVAQEVGVVRALYYLQFALGGVGFSVPLGFFLAGICIPAAFMKLLPTWIVVFGLILAAIGALSWFSMIFPRALVLIPLTRFPAFIWMIAAGFALRKKFDRSS